jgi:hypothetical protein
MVHGGGAPHIYVKTAVDVISRRPPRRVCNCQAGTAVHEKSKNTIIEYMI